MSILLLLIQPVEKTEQLSIGYISLALFDDYRSIYLAALILVHEGFHPFEYDVRPIVRLIVSVTTVTLDREKPRKISPPGLLLYLVLGLQIRRPFGSAYPHQHPVP